MRKTPRFLATILAALVACSGGCGEPEPTVPTGDPAGDAAPDACPRVGKIADRVRKVVISHPYDASGTGSPMWEVYDLSMDGFLTATGHTFAMGRQFEGEVTFTPDGEIGIVAQDDGTLGVFRFHADGTPEVVHARAAGSFYASAVAIAPDGKSALITDGNWPENGGGIYAVGIGCDGTLTEGSKLISSKNAAELLWLSDTPMRVLVAAREMQNAVIGHDAHLLQAGEYLAGGDVFSNDDYWITTMTVTTDGRYALMADASAWSAVDHRIGVVEILPTGIVRKQTLTPLAYNSPSALVASPYGNAILLLTAEASNDSITYYFYDSTDSVSPFTYGGEVAYTGSRPALPAGAVVIDRGALIGRVLVAENVGIRQVQFLVDGTVADVRFTSTGSGYDAIVGAIGVQP